MPNRQKTVWLTAVWFKEVMPGETFQDHTSYSQTEENTDFLEIFFVKTLGDFGISYTLSSWNMQIIRHIQR